jgi:hypothetical protein
LCLVAAPNTSPNVIFRMRISGFVSADEDFGAPGPMEETGANVPSDSGGLAVWWVVSCLGFSSAACKTPSQSTANLQSCGCPTFPFQA